MKSKRILSLLLALVMGLSLISPAAAAEDTTASVLKLTKTTGTVNVNKSSGKSIALRSDLRLYNGYHVATSQSSYAWINLDDTKLLKEDAVSEVEVRKQGKKLEVNLSAGNVFFDVSEKLDSDESLNISTSTMVAGIRGTSGWVEIESRTQSRFYVLDGSVQCAVSDPVTGQRKLETVDAGEMVECVVYEAGDGENDRCDIIRQEFEVSDIPGSVLTQLVEDVPLCDRILEDSGMDVLAELAKTAGGDPSGRTPDGRAASPEVIGQAQAQQARDEAETAEKIEKTQEEQDKQENSVASDVKWREPLKWTYDNGTLSISGVGAIVENPWHSQYRGLIDRVVIEEGVTSIEVNAFFEEYMLDTVTIPKSMTYIRGMAFSGCVSLKDVYYNGTKAEWAKVTNGSGALYNTKGVTIHCSDGIFTYTVTFDPTGGTVTPATATTGEGGQLASWPTPTREGYTFNGWYTEAEGGSRVSTDRVFTHDITLYAQWTQNSSAAGGTDWNINNGTLYITGSGPMEDYNDYDRAPWISGEITSIVIGDQVTSIGSSAFSGCAILTSVTIPTGVTSIGSNAFSNCYSLTSITIPTGVTSIGSGAFSLCTSLTSMTIPSSVTTISEHVFNSCTNLTSVTIQEGVTSIGDLAFTACSGLTSVTIPSSVTTIGQDVFNSCTGLTDIYFGGTRAQWNTLEENSDVAPSGTTVHCSDDASASTGAGWSFDNGVLTISSDAAMINRPWETNGLDNQAVTTVRILDGVTSISSSMFSNCSGLTSVTIPTSVTSIGTGAFFGCTSLTGVTIPDSVTSIESSAFNGCTGLTSVTIPTGVTSIGSGTFQNCTSLTSVTIPSSVTSIGNGVFSGCTSLTSVTIPSSVASIGYNTFSSCTNLTSVTIPDSVTSIGEQTFWNCTSLTSVTIPPSVVSIGYNTFTGCTVLTDIHFGGTRAQWNTLAGNAGVPSGVTVHCSDGDITTT